MSTLSFSFLRPTPEMLVSDASLGNTTERRFAAVLTQQHVSRGDIQSLLTQFQATGLEDRRRLVVALASQPFQGQSLLARWVSEAVLPGVAHFGGLNTQEQQRLWAALASSAPVEALLRIHNVLSAAQRSTPSVQVAHPLRAFADAVARVSPAAHKQAMAERLADRLTQGDRTTAEALATLMGRLHPAGVDIILQRLDRSATDTVVRASLRVHSHTTVLPNGHVVMQTSVDVSGYTALAQQVAQTRNAREKASFMAASGEVLRLLESQQTPVNARSLVQARQTVAQGMTAVILSDTNGVIDNTLLQNGSPQHSNGPQALTAYARAMIDGGQGRLMGLLVLQLQRGNLMDQDPMVYLAQQSSRRGEEPNYHRARVLGQWLGIVGDAVLSRVGPRDANAVNAAILFTGATDITKELVGVLSPKAKLASALVAAVAKPVVNKAILEWRSRLANEQTSFLENLYAAAVPRHPSGVEATAPWVTTLYANFSGLRRRR